MRQRDNEVTRARPALRLWSTGHALRHERRPARRRRLLDLRPPRQRHAELTLGGYVRARPSTSTQRAGSPGSYVSSSAIHVLLSGAESGVGLAGHLRAGGGRRGQPRPLPSTRASTRGRAAHPRTSVDPPRGVNARPEPGLRADPARRGRGGRHLRGVHLGRRSRGPGGTALARVVGAPGPRPRRQRPAVGHRPTPQAGVSEEPMSRRMVRGDAAPPARSARPQADALAPDARCAAAHRRPASARGAAALLQPASGVAIDDRPRRRASTCRGDRPGPGHRATATLAARVAGTAAASAEATGRALFAASPGSALPPSSP